MLQRVGLICLIVALPAVAALAQSPVGVSPGGSDNLARIDTRCPTFSWASPQPATTFELVAFELDGAGLHPGQFIDVGRLAGEGPALWIQLPTGALSWTPSADECLDRGLTYAWSVRSPGGPWSEARLFEVGQKPSTAEIEDALETLRLYLENEPAGSTATARMALDSAAAALAGQTAADVSVGGESADETDDRTLGVAEVGILGTTGSIVDQSAGVVGEASAMVGIADGVRGTSTSTGGTGVRGTASALTGVTAGVWGGASSPDGYGAFFFNLGLGIPGGPGLYSSGALNASPDIILGGNVFWDEPDRDDGRIHSDPLYASSDLTLQSNDDVSIRLNTDDDGDDSDFTVYDPQGQPVFNVDSSGIAFVSGDLFIGGDPLGGLLDADDVELLIQAHRAADHPKLAFVTSLTYDGNLGGLSGADSRCQARASSAGLVGSFKAWISGDSTSEEARDRLTQADVPYRRVDGVKIADDWDDLTDGSLDAPLNVDQNGNTVVSSLTAYTNTDPDGSRHELDRECGPGNGPQWNSDSEFESGAYGTVGATNGTWSWVTNNACDNFRRLYCFEQ